MEGNSVSHTRNSYIGLNGKLNVIVYNINRTRIQQNLSAQALSDKLIMIELDIHRQAIYDIESGKRTVADYELCAIVEMLNTSADMSLKDFSNYIKKEKV